MSMKITENNLKELIKESITRLLNESMGYYYAGDDFESKGTFETIINDINKKQYIFQSYVEQLNSVINELTEIGNGIIEMLNNNFNLGVRTIDNLDQCELINNELVVNVDIPTEYFAEACKKNGAVMEVFNEEAGPKDLAHLVNCGRYCNWDDLSFSYEGRMVTFKPVTYCSVRNDKLPVANIVPCQIIITKAFC